MVKRFKRTKGNRIPGTVEIKYSDDHGKIIFEWKRNQSGSNVEVGIYEFLKFFKEKMSVDLIKHIEESKQKVNNPSDKLYTLDERGCKK